MATRETAVRVATANRLRAARAAAASAMAGLAIAACGGGGASDSPPDAGGAAGGGSGGGGGGAGGTTTTYALTVARAGAGGGTVSSSPGGLDCGTTCSANFAAGTNVTLTAVSAAGSSFAGWSGACSGTATSVSIAMAGAATCTATFNAVPAATQTLGISRVGAGTGIVTSQPAGISCGIACTAAFDEGSTVTLTATAEAGSVFAGWGGDCAGVGPSASVALSAARICTARFDAQAPGSLSWDGYHIVGPAGTYSSAATIEFANGQTSQAALTPLVAVNAATGVRSVLAAGGTWVQLGTDRSAAPMAVAHGLESAFDATSGAITDYRARYSVFARSDRLYKVDHISTTGQPVAQPWGNVTTREVCGRGGGLALDPPADIASIGGYWVFHGLDRASGACVAKALRYSAGPDEAPVTLPGEPLMRIHDRARQVTGYVIASGGRRQLLDANFRNPVVLGRISAIEPLADVPKALLGSGEPRYLLTVDATAVYAYDLRNASAAPVRVYTLAGGEVPGLTTWNMVASESGATYLAFWRGTASTNVIRIAEDLTVRTLGTVPGISIRLRLTDSHVIVSTGSVLGANGLYSIPKLGGAAVRLSLTSDTSIHAFAASGQTVWYVASNPATGTSLTAIASDGASRQQLQDATWMGQQSIGLVLNHAGMLPRVCDRECRLAALVVAHGPMPVPLGGDVGRELRVYDAGSRAVIAALGTLPSSPTGAAASLTATPWQLGQKGLVDFSWPLLTAPGSRLFIFNASEAGLVETTGN